MPLTIREATTSDAAEMIELDRALALAGRGMVLALEQVNGLDEEQRRVDDAQKARAAGAATLGVVAEMDGRIVGSALLKQLGPARCNHVGVLSVGVHPEFQRRGVGRALMRHLIDHARTSGLERLELYVRSDNAPAQALYVSLGFTQECTRSKFVRLDDGTLIDDYIFSRFLSLQ